VKELVDNAPAFSNAKARVLFVYPGPADIVQTKAEEFTMDKNLPAHFEMLLDPDFAFTNLYGLRAGQNSNRATICNWRGRNPLAKPVTCPKLPLP